MSVLLITIISFLGIALGKLIFKKWFNHLSLYCFIMGGLIFLYELKLFPYHEYNSLGLVFLFSSFLSFLLGIITVIVAKDLFSKRHEKSSQSIISSPIFRNNGKILKYSLLFFSLVALFVAIQRWIVLINMFGSIPSVLVNASVVYRLNVRQEIKEFIPILPAFVYVAVFLSGIYTAFKGKFTFLTFLPFIGIILKELTYFGRAELLLTMIEFLFSFFLFRHLLNGDLTRRFRFSKGNAAIAFSLLLVLLIAAASFIRVGRGARENYVGVSRELRQLSENFIISPSVYLYLSSDVGVFSKYLEAGGEDVNFGENTFFIFHVFLSRLGIIQKPEFFSKGYHIPMWSNTGTYLRELHADFGIAGVLLVPYLIGLTITWLWFKFYEEKSLYVFAFLVYFYLIIGFSFLTLVTKLNQWYISLLLILIFLPLIEKLAIRKYSLIPRLK